MTSPRRVPIFDGHNDVLLRLYRRGGTDAARAFLEGEAKGQLDLPMAQQGGFAGGLFAIFVPSTDAGLVRSIDRLDHLPDGLRWLASRGAAASFDALIANLAAQTQPGQFVGRLQTLVSQLPLPELLPPAQIGKARRIDATAHICALAKAFSNCLAAYVRLIDDGECVIYFWDDQAAPAVCQITRHGRLGWSLSEALGPRNTKLDCQQLQEITTAFAAAAIPPYSTFRSLKCILEADCASRPRTRRQRRQDLDQRLWELHEMAWVQDAEDVG
jgi:membrane dipeptidase (peptidase family M19)